MHAFRTLSLAVVAAGSAAAGDAAVPAAAGAAGDLRTLLQQGPVPGAADWRLSPEQRAQLRRQLADARRSDATATTTATTR